ncbi:hypothetical protein PO124_25020 [Bacillus licheniformis]|nr:hypothetical protein [Bacillus licheniformis]
MKLCGKTHSLKTETLKEIAETLNEGNDLKETLHAVLKKLLRLTGLKRHGFSDR